ncbi:MoaD/ThiS family protein [Bacillota bacterium LX-D]|nr:MoaD/ThiS family protein [Bacillota bacterium LX-D]
MEVKVKLFATLREGRFKEKTMEIGQQSRVLDVIEKCGLPLEEVAISLVNGRDVDNDHELQNGDILALFPPVGGG